MSKAGHCSCCNHPQAPRLNADLLEGATDKSIAEKYGGVSRDSVRRHRIKHVKELLEQSIMRAKAKRDLIKQQRKAKEVQRDLDQLQGDDLVARLKKNSEIALHLLVEAREAKQYGPAIAAIGQVTRIVELIARLTGELDESTRVNVMVDARQREEQSAIADLRRLTLPERLELERLLRKVKGLADVDVTLTTPAVFATPTLPDDNADDGEGATDAP